MSVVSMLVVASRSAAVAWDTAEQKHYKCVSPVFVIQKEFPLLICYSCVQGGWRQQQPAHKQTLIIVETPAHWRFIPLGKEVATKVK